MSAKSHQHDVLIIGGGAAGMTLALKLSQTYQVALLCKDVSSEGSTYYAQGGVAAVLDEYDSVDSHIQDTLVAGAGLCHEDVVKYTVEQSPAVIQWLVDLGVKFDVETQLNGRQEFHLTQEGGHSHRRVIHAADATGWEIGNTLATQVREQTNITLFERYAAVDLITADMIGQPGKQCIGAYVLNLETQEVEIFQARFVVLAT
ncbi:MAG: L-aspartate oxidase, partial [Crocinitomicaceae bacterium]